MKRHIKNKTDSSFLCFINLDFACCEYMEGHESCPTCCTIYFIPVGFFILDQFCMLKNVFKPLERHHYVPECNYVETITSRCLEACLDSSNVDVACLITFWHAHRRDYVCRKLLGPLKGAIMFQKGNCVTSHNG